MGIISSMYNTLWYIFRVSDPIPNAMGEIGSEQYVKVSNNVQGRLSTFAVAEPLRDGMLKEAGEGSAYRFKFFTPSGTDIKVGDRLVRMGSTNERYYVDHVNSSPGGLTDHHQECLVTASTFMVAS